MNEATITSISTIRTETVGRRLRPLYVATFLGGLGFWIPVEKLFMDEIGFDAASVGVMAAAYAGVVPFLEMPSGVLADRWSRRGVLILGYVALTIGAFVGGLSGNVAMYVVSALFLGVFFAMRSGTLESVVYDTVLEVTNDSTGFEKHLGRVQATESAALVLSALAGGLLAAVVSPRFTYFLTVPLVASSIIALMAFREPQLHKAGDDATSLRTQLTVTYRTILERGRMRQIIILMVLTALLLQSLLEFGPLWMVAMAAPAILFGPHWAGLMSALGLGGILGSRLPTNRSGTFWVVAVMVASSVVLATSHAVALVIAAQVVLAVLLVATGIVLTRQLHDSVPSAIRAGVSSGVGTVTWLTFMPFALVFGMVSNRVGVHAAGWMIVAVTVATAATLLRFVTCVASAGSPDCPAVSTDRSPVYAESAA